MRKEGRLLTGHAKLKGKTILDFSLLVPLVENLFPPRTGVDPVPKLQVPAAETRDWYSFRQTLKYVSHSSRVHLRSDGFLAPPQHEPFCSSPFAFCIDTISSSKCPDASDTCWAEQTLNPCITFSEIKSVSFYSLQQQKLFAKCLPICQCQIEKYCLSSNKVFFVLFLISDTA